MLPPHARMTAGRAPRAAWEPRARSPPTRRRARLVPRSEAQRAGQPGACSLATVSSGRPGAASAIGPLWRRALTTRTGMRRRMQARRARGLRTRAPAPSARVPPGAPWQRGTLSRRAGALTQSAAGSLGWWVLVNPREGRPRCARRLQSATLAATRRPPCPSPRTRHSRWALHRPPAQALNQGRPGDSQTRQPRRKGRRAATEAAQACNRALPRQTLSQLLRPATASRALARSWPCPRPLQGRALRARATQGRAPSGRRRRPRRRPACRIRACQVPCTALAATRRSCRPPPRRSSRRCPTRPRPARRRSRRAPSRGAPAPPRAALPWSRARRSAPAGSASAAAAPRRAVGQRGVPAQPRARPAARAAAGVRVPISPALGEAPVAARALLPCQHTRRARPHPAAAERRWLRLLAAAALREQKSRPRQGQSRAGRCMARTRAPRQPRAALHRLRAPRRPPCRMPGRPTACPSTVACARRPRRL